MALRGRFEQPIVGLEATCVTIRIRSTLVGRAGFEPARFSRRVTGLQPSGIDQLTHLPDVKELTRVYSLAEGRRVERQSAVAHWFSKPGGIADIPRLPGRQLPIQ